MENNSIRITEIDGKVIATTDHGSFEAFEKKDFEDFSEGKLSADKIKSLEEKGIILTDKSKEMIISKMRKKYSFLFTGPNLHIVVPTLRCNYRCSYCHASSRKCAEKGYDMDEETARKTVDFIFQTNAKSMTIEFQGGEPLLNFEIVKFIVNYANQKNEKEKKDLHFVIVTNLSAMDDEKLNYILENDIGVCSSFDGPKELNDANRSSGSHDIFAKWKKKIDSEFKKKGSGRRVGALLTVTKESLKNPKEIIDEYINQGIDRVHIRMLNNFGYAQSEWEKIGYSAEQFIDFWKKAVDYIIEKNKGKSEGPFLKFKEGKVLLDMPIIKERMVEIMLSKVFNEHDPGFLDLRSPCGAGIGQMLYNYDGNIYSCDEGRMIGEDVFRIGDVGMKMEEVLSSSNTCSIVASSINDTQFCDTCAWKPYCGLCPVCTYSESGSVVSDISSSMRCKVLKAQFEYVFRTFIIPQLR